MIAAAAAAAAVVVVVVLELLALKRISGETAEAEGIAWLEI